MAQHTPETELRRLTLRSATRTLQRNVPPPRRPNTPRKILWLDQIGLTPTGAEDLTFITQSRQAAKAGNAPGTVAGHLHPFRGALFHPAFSPRLRASAVKIFYLDLLGLTLSR